MPRIVQENKRDRDVKGILDEEYIEIVFEQLARTPAYRMFTSNYGKEDGCNIVRTILDSLNLVVEDELISELTFCELTLIIVAILSKNIKQGASHREIEGYCMLLNLYLSRLVRMSYEKPLLQDIRKVNYLALRKVSNTHMLQICSQEDQALYEKEEYAIEQEFEGRFTFKEVCNLLFDGIRKGWVPMQESIEEYRSYILQTYVQIKDDVLYPLVLGMITYPSGREEKLLNKYL